MKAKEYLRIYQSAMRHFDEVSRIVDELSLIRHDKEATQAYCCRYLVEDAKDAEYEEWLEFHRKYGASALEPEQAPTVRQELLKVVDGDNSFGFITALLTSQEPSPETIYKALLEELMLLQPTKADSVEIEERSTEIRTQKVTTDALVEILAKAGVKKGNTADATKISKLIAYLTGYSAETIRQRLSNTEELTKRHKIEVDKINQIFKELNMDITIKYNKTR